MRLPLALCLSLLAVPAAAQTAVTVSFQQSNADDSFYVENVADCIGALVDEISIDFTSAQGALFFDSARGKPGYEDQSTYGLQPVQGSGYIAGVKVLEDGGRTLTLQLTGFDPGAQLRFVLDVDDEAGPEPGARDDALATELAGTLVAAKMMNPAGATQAELGTFGRSGDAAVAWDGVCDTVR